MSKKNISRKRIVIIGGAVGGPAAARGARWVDAKAEIILFERAADVGYSAGGLGYYLSREVRKIGDLVTMSVDELQKKYKIDIRKGWELESIHAGDRSIVVKKGSQREIISYSALVYTAGARSDLKRIAGGEEADNVFRFRSLADLRKIEAYRRKNRARRVVVLGGGFFGIEAAEGFRKAGCTVTVIEKEPRLFKRFHPLFAKLVEAELAANGITLFKKASIAEAKVARGRLRKARLSNGEWIDLDLLIQCAGVVPNVEMLIKAGAKPGPFKTVLVNKKMRTSLPGVYAAGVCASLPHPFTGRAVWYPQAAAAEKTGRSAGANAAGAGIEAASLLGTSIVRVFGAALGRTGLTEAEAADYLGGVQKVGTAFATSTASSQIMKTPGTLTARIIFARKSGRLLGAEAWGNGVDKFIDALALAILAEMTIDRLAYIDFAYSPPYSPLLNVINKLALSAGRG